MTAVKIERVKKVNDKHACRQAVQTTLLSTQTQIKVKICHKTQNKVSNLILPAEAASMPSKQQQVLWVSHDRLLAASWDPNSVVHQGTRAGHRGGLSAAAIQSSQLLSIKFCSRKCAKKYTSGLHI